MAPPGPPPKEESPRKPRQNNIPPKILEIMLPAIQAGGLCGGSGLVVGAFAGVIRSSSPTLFALASGIQWFTLGTTFFASRGAILHAWGKDKVTPREHISAGAIAGAASGGVGGLLRGPKNILPGMIMFALFGAASQKLYNVADKHISEAPEAGQDSKKNSWLNGKYSPVKVLTDKEYEEMLREKLLHVNVDIALVDERIEELKGERETTLKKEI